MTNAAPEIKPLDGIRVVLLALNVPGPVAAQRLASLGATIVKVESPAGDPLITLSAAWYAELCTNFHVRRIDLKTEPGQASVERLLAESDLLITSFRPSSLTRLNLNSEQVAARHPTLCQIAIVGHALPHAEVAGHDITYQAAAGLVTPPHMPITLLADLTGAERTVSTAMMLLFNRARGATNLFAEVSLEASLGALLAPLRHELTTMNGPLNGANPLYRLYETRKGWIALAALEPHFIQRLRDQFATDIANSGVKFPDVEALQKVFMQKSANEWEAWAKDHDIPIVEVQQRKQAFCQGDFQIEHLLSS
ncbi:MAG: CoA transferase [Gemmatimonadaceae bacterium]